MRTKKTTIFPFLTFAFLVGIAPVWSAEVSPVGTILMVRGKVMVARPFGSAMKQIQAQNKLSLFEKDELTSGNDGEALIRLNGGHVIKLNKRSFYRVTEHRFNESEGVTQSHSKLLYGKMRASIRKLKSDKGATFTVQTPNATIGVRGTDFTTQFDEKGQVSKVTTHHGEVSLKGVRYDPLGNIAQATEELRLGSGQASAVEGSGQSQTLPKVVSASPEEQQSGPESDDTFDEESKDQSEYYDHFEDMKNRERLWRVLVHSGLLYSDQFRGTKEHDYRHEVLAAEFLRSSRQKDRLVGFGIGAGLGIYQIGVGKMEGLIKINGQVRFHLPFDFFATIGPSILFLTRDVPFFWPGVGIHLSGGYEWVFRPELRFTIEIGGFYGHFHSMRDLLGKDSKRPVPFFNAGGMFLNLGVAFP